MAQLKAVLPIKGRRKVHAGSRSCKSDCKVHCQLSIILNVWVGIGKEREVSEEWGKQD